MRKKNIYDFFLILSVMSIAMVICRCNKATGGIAPDIPPPQGDFFITSINYLSTSDSIITFQQICGCFGDLPSSDIIRNAYAYKTTEQNLVVTMRDSVSMACTTRHYLTFDRLSGSGLVCNWLFDSAWYTLQGSPTSLDSSKADTINKGHVKTAYKWIAFDSAKKVINIYTDQDTTTFASDFFTQHKHELDSQHISLDSVLPNIVCLRGVHYKANDTTAYFDTLTISNSYRAGITIYRTSDTTKYSPDPYVYTAGTMCSSKSLPPWISQFLHDVNPFSR